MMMKKFLWVMAAILISGLSVVTTSCSNEDTPVHATPGVSGTWISVEDKTGTVTNENSPYDQIMRVIGLGSDGKAFQDIFYLNEGSPIPSASVINRWNLEGYSSYAVSDGKVVISATEALPATTLEVIGDQLVESATIVYRQATKEERENAEQWATEYYGAGEETDGSVSYFFGTFNEKKQKMDYQVKSAADVIKLEGANGETQVLSGGKWYLVTGDVKRRNVVVNGEAHLILGDGSTLSLTAGVQLEAPSALNIYSQSFGERQGRLNAYNENKNEAAIGTHKNAEDSNGNIVGMGTLKIYGGVVIATASDYGAGIGGGFNRGIAGSLTVYGGTVSATGGQYGAGVGGGEGGGQGGPVSVYGGTLYATGGENAAGVGGGDTYNGGGGEGGKVYAIAGTLSAIGGIECRAFGTGHDYMLKKDEGEVIVGKWQMCYAGYRDKGPNQELYSWSRKGAAYNWICVKYTPCQHKGYDGELFFTCSYCDYTGKDRREELGMDW